MKKINLVLLLLVISSVLISSFEAKQEKEDEGNGHHHKIVKRQFWSKLKKFWDTIKHVIDTIVDIINHLPPGWFGIFGCPHIISSGKELQTCDIYSEKPVSFIQSDYLSIDMGFTKIDGVTTKTPGSLISSVSFTFRNGRDTMTLTAKDPSQPIKPVFDNGSNEIKDSKTGKLWIGIYPIDIEGDDPAESAVFIFDSASKSLITLYQRRGEKNKWYNLMMYADNDTYAHNAKGLFVEGCPKEWINTETPKESEICAKLDGFTEKSLNSEVVRRTCNHDSQYDEELAKSMYSFMDVANTLTQVKDIVSYGAKIPV